MSHRMSQSRRCIFGVSLCCCCRDCHTSPRKLHRRRRGGEEEAPTTAVYADRRGVTATGTITAASYVRRNRALSVSPPPRREAPEVGNEKSSLNYPCTLVTAVWKRWEETEAT
nr:hypothetical protein Itr_chr04CG16450 [Ipomoea trifida]